MLKLNVGFNRKIGEANYGSRGASVNLELELDSGLVGDADRLKERIRQLFCWPRRRWTKNCKFRLPVRTRMSERYQRRRHGSKGRQRDGTRKATASQVRALHAIADRQAVNLAEKLQAAYGVRDPAELSITEASSLIDELKGAGNGHGGGR